MTDQDLFSTETAGLTEVTRPQVGLHDGSRYSLSIDPVRKDLDAGGDRVKTRLVNEMDQDRPMDHPFHVHGAALELPATRTVELSVGRRIPTVPQRPLGRDVWWWASGLRLNRVTADSRLGRRLSGRDQIVGTGPRRLARRHGVTVRPRVDAVADRGVTFADGGHGEYDVVVWATGFSTDDTWIDVPDATDERGRLRQRRGVTPSPGLYTLGRSWQHTRGSALLGWVGNDAAFLAEQIAGRAG